MYRIVILCVILVGWAHTHHLYRMIPAFQKYRWVSLEYQYPNETARQHAIDVGDFILNAVIPTDFHQHNHETVGSRRFIATPRSACGVPATVGYLPNDTTTHYINPRVIPYPNWEMNTVDKNCEHMISVHHLYVDECDRLWIIDTGILLNDPICPPKILVYNLLTDELIRRYQFDLRKILAGTKLMTSAVDVRENKCDDAFVYIADPERNQLFVYDYKKNKSWNFRNKHFYPDPDYGTLTIRNSSYEVMSGISGMILGPLKPCNCRTLYFHTFASVKQKYVRTLEITLAQDVFENNPGAHVSSFQEYSFERSSQSASVAISKVGILFFISLSNNVISCWNTEYDFSDSRVDTVREMGFIEFPTSLKIEIDENGLEQLVIMLIPHKAIFNGNANEHSDYNAQMLKYPVHDMINGTKCDPNYYFLRNVLDYKK